MTVELFDVDRALEAEDTKLERIRRALNWKLRAKERGEEELEAAIEASEESVPPEAH